MTVLCPTCNTAFTDDTAPWLKQKQYCPKHDRVHFGVCEFCTPEEQVEVKAAQEKALTDVAEQEKA